MFKRAVVHLHPPSALPTLQTRASETSPVSSALLQSRQQASPLQRVGNTRGPPQSRAHQSVHVIQFHSVPPLPNAQEYPLARTLVLQTREPSKSVRLQARNHPAPVAGAYATFPPHSHLQTPNHA